MGKLKLSKQKEQTGTEDKRKSLKEMLEIDRNALDFSCLTHSMNFAEASESMVKSSFNRDKCKQELELLKAKIELVIRSNPEYYGLAAKPTEGAIKSALIANDDIRSKEEELIQLNYEANIWTGIKVAFEHKKSCLEMLVKLYIAGYWADPVANSKVMDKMSDSATEKAMADELEANPRLSRRRNG
jgi:hypothetical protein